jgi:hypothetical protein
MLARGTEDKEHAMSQKLNSVIAVIGIDIGKNSFHLIGQNKRGAIAMLASRTSIWPRDHFCRNTRRRRFCAMPRPVN